MFDILFLLLYTVNEVRVMKQHFDPRQEMHNRQFEIFHYSETENVDVDIHHHDFYEVYLFLDGDVQYWVEGTLYTLKPYDIMIVSPMELHRPIINKKSVYERVVLWIDKEYFRKSAGELDLEKCFSTGILHASRELSETLLKLAREFNGNDEGKSTYCNALLMQFTVLLYRRAFKSERVVDRQSDDSLSSQVLKFVNAHYSEKLTLDTLAKQFYVSKYYLSHQFSSDVGVSVYRYIMIKRLITARRMLEEGVPAGEVCDTVGFKDYAGFYRAFRSEFGISPSSKE